jgi:hypothetical protein
MRAEEVYFQQSDPLIKNQALIKKTNACLFTANYSQAIQTLDRVALIEMPDSFIYQYHLLFATSFYLNKEFENALSEITKSEIGLSAVKRTPQQAVLKIICLNELYRWEESRKEVDTLFQKTLIHSSKNDSLYKVISGMLVHKNQPKIKKITSAKNWSTFIPGAGQIYTGSIQEGLVNTTLELASLGFMAFSIYKGFYFSGVLIGYTLLQRFYLGGLHRLDYLVAEKNKSISIQYNQTIKRELLQLKNS